MSYFKEKPYLLASLILLVPGTIWLLIKPGLYPCIILAVSAILFLIEARKG